VISHSYAFRASRRLKFSYKSILPCTAFPCTLVSMLELSPPLPSLLLLPVGGLSRLNTRAIGCSSRSDNVDKIVCSSLYLHLFESKSISFPIISSIMMSLDRDYRLATFLEVRHEVGVMKPQPKQKYAPMDVTSGRIV
jgi:hypothetical protein